MFAVCQFDEYKKQNAPSSNGGYGSKIDFFFKNKSSIFDFFLMHKMEATSEI